MELDEVRRILLSPEGREETRRVRHLRVAVEVTTQVIAQGGLRRDEAEALVDGVAELAEYYFPGSSDTFAIVYGRRFKRLLDEVFGLPAA